MIRHPTSHLIFAEHLKRFFSEKSFERLIAPFVFGILKNILKDTAGSQIYHYDLILELVELN